MTTVQPMGTAASATDYVPRHAAWLHEAQVPAPSADASPKAAEMAMRETGMSATDSVDGSRMTLAATDDTSDDYVTIKEPRRSWRRKNAPAPTPAN
jgi:hypothetical protein